MDFSTTNLKDGIDNIWWVILKPLFELIAIIVLCIFFLLNNLIELDFSTIELTNIIYSENIKDFIEFYYLSGVFPFICIVMLLLASSLIKWVLIVLSYNLPFYFVVKEDSVFLQKLTFDEFCKVRLFIKDKFIDIAVMLKYIRATANTIHNTYSDRIKIANRIIYDLVQRMHILKGLVYLELMIFISKYLRLRTTEFDFSLEYIIFMITLFVYFQSLISLLKHTRELIENEKNAFFEVKNTYENYSLPSAERQLKLHTEFSNMKASNNLSSIKFDIKLYRKLFFEEFYEILLSFVDYITQKKNAFLKYFRN